MAQTILTLSELPINTKTVPISGLLRDLETARQSLAGRRAATALIIDEAEAQMDDIDNLIGVILQTQCLLSSLVEAGLLPLDFEGGPR